VLVRRDHYFDVPELWQRIFARTLTKV